MGFTEAREFLRKCREQNDRKPQQVVDYFISDIESNLNRLGDEKWIVLEQVAIAGLELKDWDTVKKCTSGLSRQYPGSDRVRKLKAMHLEALERYDDANNIYDQILANDETNAAIHKRKIAILKAQGNTEECIEKLCDYVKKFQSDTEAWMELCHLYIQENEFHKAAFCMEELIVHQPYNHLYHQRYAELLYLQGNTDSIETARSYFAYALKLNPNNMEALLGFYTCANFLSTSQKLTSQKKTDNKKYLDWAVEQIKTLYKKKMGAIEGKEPAIEDLMAKMSIEFQTPISKTPVTKNAIKAKASPKAVKAAPTQREELEGTS